MIDSNNKYRISVTKLRKLYEYDDLEEFIESFNGDSIAPACCSEGCEVEPDGVCQHGCPSVLLALGLI
jgi:hypothetical protein